MTRETERRPSGDIVIVGAGGFARETLDVIEDMNDAGSAELRVLGLIDVEQESENRTRWARRGLSVIADDDEWLANPQCAQFALAIGAPGLRRRIVQKYLTRGLSAPALRHPTAVVGRCADIERGTVICAGAVVSSHVRIGEFVHINPHVTIGHDAQIRAYASVNPGAIISGHVLVEHEALVGAGAVVLEQLRIGERAVVGAAACATRSVSDGVTVKGVPAR